MEQRGTNERVCEMLVKAGELRRTKSQQRSARGVRDVRTPRRHPERSEQRRTKSKDLGQLRVRRGAKQIGARDAGTGSAGPRSASQ